MFMALCMDMCVEDTPSSLSDNILDIHYTFLLFMHMCSSCCCLEKVYGDMHIYINMTRTPLC